MRFVTVSHEVSENLESFHVADRIVEIVQSQHVNDVLRKAIVVLDGLLHFF